MTDDRTELALALLAWSDALEDERVSFQAFSERKERDGAELLALEA